MLSSFALRRRFEEVPFNTRVKNIAIAEAQNYEKVYIDYEYLVFVSRFKKYYIIAGTDKNYLHLVGVHTTLNPSTFFVKCKRGDLRERDFDFIDGNGKDIKGTVRRKIQVLGNMVKLMQQEELYVQETFKKNRVICSVGATDSVCTIGFIKSSNRKTAKAFPKTLMKGNELKNPQKVELLLRRKSGSGKFDEIIIGNRGLINKNLQELKEVLDVSLYSDTEKVCKSRSANKKNGVYEKVKIPICFNPNTYSEKLKRAKIENRR